ncbi:MAG: DUF7002 family protein [Janthinobacterium lividum]
MTDPELAEFLADCPTLFHMAARDAWPSILAHGLLSTSALLDLHGVRGPARDAVESALRPTGVTLHAPGLPPAVVRDQHPLGEAGLRRCLRDGLSPADWCRLLNRRAFLWPSRARLLRLLDARPYRDDAHAVIELDAARVLAAHRDRITLCAINSGQTRRNAAPRGLSTFLPVADYPYAHWRRRRPRGERVVELAVEPGLPDVAPLVRRVVLMRGADILETLHEAAPA